MQLAIALQQDFHFAFGFFQLLAAGTGKFHALIEKLQRAIERDVPLLEFSHDLFQSLERLFEFRQAQTPLLILVHNGFGERKNLESIGCGGKYFLSTCPSHRDFSKSSQEGDIKNREFQIAINILEVLDWRPPCQILKMKFPELRQLETAALEELLYVRNRMFMSLN